MCKIKIFKRYTWKHLIGTKMQTNQICIRVLSDGSEHELSAGKKNCLSMILSRELNPEP